MNPLILGPIFDLIGKGLDKWFPDPEQKARFQLDLLRMQQEGEFREAEIQIRAILAEAQSNDPWTSRARPSFMYVFYFVILAMVVGAPVLGVFFPEQMDLFFANVGKGFAAIPEAMWWTFSAGYLGYAGARTYEKRHGVSR